MKDFIERNRILSRLGLIAALISISYAITFNMPAYFGVEGWYSLLNNISKLYCCTCILCFTSIYARKRK